MRLTGGYGPVRLRGPYGSVTRGKSVRNLTSAMFVVTWPTGLLRVWGVCLRYFDHVIAKANQNTLRDL